MSSVARIESRTERDVAYCMTPIERLRYPIGLSAGKCSIRASQLEGILISIQFNLKCPNFGQCVSIHSVYVLLEFAQDTVRIVKDMPSNSRCPSRSEINPHLPLLTRIHKPQSQESHDSINRP